MTQLHTTQADAALAPIQLGYDELEIRPSQAEDVPALSAIFAGAYGESYPYPPTVATVCPERGYFLTALVNREIIGCAGGAGHSDEGYHWTEWGRLVVMKDERFRGKGYGSALNRARLARLIAGELALSETVCNNTRNQGMLAKLGFHALGILLGRYPGILTERLGDQPESVLMNFFWENGSFGGLGTRRLFVPDDWIEGLQLLLPHDRLHNALCATNGVVRTQRVRRYRPFADPVHGIEGCAMVDVVVNHPNAIEIIAGLRAEGFELCAFMPGIADTEVGGADRVRLSRTAPDVEIDWSLVKVCSQIAPFKDWMSRAR